MAHLRLQEQKARALFEKYNMALEPGEWIPARGTGNTDWVEKKHRIRVHRQCHRCQMGFGTDKNCTQCGHIRCKKCPRFPTKSGGTKEAPSQAKALIAVDNHPRFHPSAATRQAAQPLTMMTKHGTELHYKSPVHRVRRTCHRCDALFNGKATQCETCQHLRCPKCPREP